MDLSDVCARKTLGCWVRFPLTDRLAALLGQPLAQHVDWVHDACAEPDARDLARVRKRPQLTLAQPERACSVGCAKREGADLHRLVGRPASRGFAGESR